MFGAAFAAGSGGVGYQSLGRQVAVERCNLQGDYAWPIIVLLEKSASPEPPRRRVIVCSRGHRGRFDRMRRNVSARLRTAVNGTSSHKGELYRITYDPIGDKTHVW